MKQRNETDFPLRDAFPEMPADCYDALMRAARSVEEETKMRRFTVRTILIAAVLAIVTMAAALAASEMLGWTDFFTRYGDGVIVPRAAQEIMNETEKQSFRLGPMTFTVRQLMCDGQLAACAADIRTADGSPALYCYDPYDLLGCNGENGRALAERLGLPWDTAYVDAAKQLGLPLYWCEAWLECDESPEGMGDPLWNDDNTMTFFSMAYLDLEEVPEALSAELYLFVARIDPETGEAAEGETLEERVPITIPVHAQTEERIYRPVRPFTVGGLTLQSVRLERTIAGAYLYADFTADEGVDQGEIYDRVRFLDADGQPFPVGMSLSGFVDAERLPAVTIGDMIAVEELPQRFIVAIDDQQIIVE